MGRTLLWKGAQRPDRDELVQTRSDDDQVKTSSGGRGVPCVSVNT